jgi:hypothetical protein
MSLGKLCLKTVYHYSLLSTFLLYALLNEHRSALAVVFLVLLVSYALQVRVTLPWSLAVDKLFLLMVAIGLIVVLSVGQLLWVRNDHSLLLAMPLFLFVLFFSCNSTVFRRALFVFLFFMVVASVYEKFSGRYIFVGSLDVNGAKVVLDEGLYGGAAGDLRSKAFFYGPLTFSAFLIGAAFVLRSNKLALFLCFIGAVMAISRTSMILVPAIALAGVALGSKRNIPLSFVFLLFFIIAAAIGVALSPSLLERIIETFDFTGNSATNSARAYYWLSGLDEFSKYSGAEKIFGNNGQYRYLYNNNAESGWITLLLDFGLVGLSLYILPLAYLLLRRPTAENLYLVGVLLIANMVFTLSYGVTGCFVYWMIVFDLMKVSDI